MRLAKRPALLVVSGLALLSLVLGGFFAFHGTTRASAATDGPTYSRLTSLGTSTFTSSAEGSDDLQNPEIAGGAASDGGNVVNRSLSHGHGARPTRDLPTPVVDSSAVASTATGLNTSFNGLNFRQQRLANGGNQFSIEPPDQGLCAGNGYVMESVNDVLRVWDTNGNALKGVTALNTFYHYPAAINRATGIRGPFVTDPSCYFDGQTQRWFQIVLTLDVVPTTGADTGGNHLDLAVSQTADPTGTWNLYSIPSSDDGSQGQPSHTNCPCLGDYPHIGADANGFYITTNEYPFFANGFNGAQLYAISKRALAAGATSPTVVHFDTLSVAGNPGFTVIPAISTDGQFATAQNGSEYFLSSMAGTEANNLNGIDNRLGLWTLTNTASLDSDTPALALQSRSMPSEVYGTPPPSNQKTGDFPLGQCLNTPACATTFLLGRPDPYTETEAALDSSDTRMMQVTYVNGNLFGALDTVVNVGGADEAGIAWFEVHPNVTGNGTVVGNPVAQGYVAVANNNITYPALAVLPSGKGVMAFTLVGADYFPSAAYATFDTASGVSEINVAAAGLGPQDGFTGYKAFVGDPTRPRWGDYGAAAIVGNSVWIASEYTGQTCTLAQYESRPFGSCGGTRTSLGNWYTRISQVTP